MPVARTATTWGPQTFQDALAAAATGVIRVQDIALQAGQVQRLIAALPEHSEHPGRRKVDQATFQNTSFPDDARFDGVIFMDGAYFGGAQFKGDAFFGGATFTQGANFTSATFGGDAYFLGATFNGGAAFGDTTFGGRAEFGSTKFPNGAGNFGGARFQGTVGFGDATFGSYAIFDGATFRDGAGFAEATFEREADFAGTLVSGDLYFDDVSFDFTRNLGPIAVEGDVSFLRARFSEPLTITLRARHARFIDAEFRGGVDLLVACGAVSLEGAQLGAASLLAGVEQAASPVSQGEMLGSATTQSGPQSPGMASRRIRGRPPRLTSVQRARVSTLLTLSGLDLSACRFARAHGLDRLRLERCILGGPPRGWQRSLRHARWTARETVAEEHLWRWTEGHGTGWCGNEGPVAPSADAQSEVLEPKEIASIYRALRKGREDEKDEPGAADFYYGEMEMRRQRGANRDFDDTAHAHPSSRNGPKAVAAPGNEEDGGQQDRPAERGILRAYWLVSGYGLRASRALIALGVTVATLAVALDLWGFQPDQGYGRALLFATESSISLLRAPTTRLTDAGEVVQIVLRLAGPLFFGLALLALRGRVKR
jgi:Pentapeptide repeats (9 copies)